MHIVGICGSLQAASSNRTLLERVPALLPAVAAHDVVYEIFDGVRDLPPFDPDVERDGEAPEPVRLMRAVIGRADALLIASPEYGHSLPGSLKNAIDWMIGSGELERKVVAVTAAVVHPARGRRGLDALLGTLAAVSARVVGGQPTVLGEAFDSQLSALLSELIGAASVPDPAFT